MTLFLNPTENSYQRLGTHKAPKYISWSAENRSQLIRIPAAESPYIRAELRSPDPTLNPYIAYALIIYACLDGIENGLELPPAADINLFTASEDILAQYESLPSSLEDARALAKDNTFIRTILNSALIDAYCKN